MLILQLHGCQTLQQAGGRVLDWRAGGRASLSVRSYANVHTSKSRYLIDISELFFVGVYVLTGH